MARVTWLAWLFVAAPLAAQEGRPEVVVEQGVVFGKGGRRELKLDLARPAEGDGPFPMIVCIHGGGWVGGDRAQMSETIRTLARCGYVAVSPDYRVAPANRFPAAVEDCKAAVRWLRANAKTYHGDPERIGALGFSAGGYLACLLGVTDKGDGLEGNGGNAGQSSRVQAVVSFFGPTDLASDEWGPIPVEKNLVPFLGGTRAQKADAYRKASPISYPGKGAPPFLFFHGTEDRIVSPSQSRRLAEKLEKAGVQTRVVLVEGEGHGWRGEKLLITLDQTMKFLDSHLKK